MGHEGAPVGVIEQPRVEAKQQHFAEWGQWDARGYLNEFYPEVHEDERHTLLLHVNALKKRKDQLPLVDRPIAAEIGAGPTLHRAIMLAPYAKELHLYEYLQQNRKELELWLNNERGAFNWDPHIIYVLQAEKGNLAYKPSRDEIERRADLVRRKTTYVGPIDLSAELSSQSFAQRDYSLLVSAYVADSATTNPEDFHSYMSTITSFVAPGGLFLTAGLRNAGHYKIGDTIFPSANVNETHLRASLIENGFYPETIKTVKRKLPEHIEQGYGGLFTGIAIKNLHSH